MNNGLEMLACSGSREQTLRKPLVELL